MEFEATIKIYGKEYKFEGNEDNPLTFILTFDEKTYIQRDIDCDDNNERMRLVRKEVSILNGKEKNIERVEQIYYGKEIEHIDFMQMLLENSLIWYLGDKPTEPLPKEEDVISSKNDMELLNEMLIKLARAKGVGIRRKLVYLNRYIETLGKKKI
jgi:hypothetical protein